MSNPESISTDHDYPLPKVSQDIGDSIVADFRNTGVEPTFMAAHNTVESDNKGLILATNKLLGSFGITSKSELQVAYITMVMTHETLSRQALANRLAAQFQIGVTDSSEELDTKTEPDTSLPFNVVDHLGEEG